MLNLLIGSRSISVDLFFPAEKVNVDMFLKWAYKTHQLSDVQLVVEYLRDKAKRLEENADYIEKHMEDGE
jgi:hypothetical protein